MRAPTDGSGYSSEDPSVFMAKFPFFDMNRTNYGDKEETSGQREWVCKGHIVDQDQANCVITAMIRDLQNELNRTKWWKRFGDAYNKYSSDSRTKNQHQQFTLQRICVRYQKQKKRWIDGSPTTALSRDASRSQMLLPCLTCRMYHNCERSYVHKRLVCCKLPTE